MYIRIVAFYNNIVSEGLVLRLQQILVDHTMRELIDYPDPSFPLGIWTDDYRTFVNHTMNCHWHNEFEFGVMISGELNYYMNGQCIQMKKGDWVFVNSNTMHMAIQPEGSEAVMFTLTFLPSLLTGGNSGTVLQKYFQPVLHTAHMGVVIKVGEDDGSAGRMLEEIYALNQNVRTAEHYELQCISLLSRIWSRTLRCMGEHSRKFIEFKPDCKHEGKAKDILSYIQEHYAENISIRDITQCTGISRSECFRCFQRFTHKKPMEYLTEYRLAHAAKLVRDTDKSIAQICTECGFSSSSYFGKLFKEKYALTPTQFKRV